MILPLPPALVPHAAVLGAAAAFSPLVSQKGKQFSAAEVTVKPGEPLVFLNDDALTHNVFSATPGFSFNLKAQAPGTQAQATFDKEGSLVVRCAFHPTMKLTVTVKQ